MKKTAITKIITMFVIVSLLLSSVVITGATKVDDVYRDGAIFKVTHDNPKYPTAGVSEEERNNNHVIATGLLCEQIEAVTYAEILMFDINTLYVGLPYESVELVKSLDTVQKVEKVEDEVSTKNPEEKLSPELVEFIKTSADDDTIEVGIYLCYNTLVYYGFCQEDFSDTQDYIEAQRAKQTDHFTSKNKDIFDKICEKADVELLSNAKLRNYITVKTKVSELSKIALVDSVSGIEHLVKEEPSVAPTPTETPTDSTFKYKQKFEDYVKFEEYDPNADEGKWGEYFDYGELYEHYDETNCEVDWALITAKIDLPNPWDVLETKKIGNRVLSWWTYGAGCFPYALIIYDAKADEFRDIGVVKPDEYVGLVDAIEELKLGDELGDADLDGEVGVLDATCIQMYVADILKSNTIEFQHIRGVADMDGDKEVTVLDATAVQMKIAKIEK